MYRGRGNKRPRGGKSWRSDRLSDDNSSPELPLGSLLKSVRQKDLSKHASLFLDSASITDVALIASYNWLDKKSPVILIPGAPPKWTPPRGEPRLKEDSGVYYRDKNACRLPQHPMEPMIEAIMRMNPHTTAQDVDIVACGSTLGNLLRFVRGEDRNFRMLVEVVDDAVHLIRRENSPTEVIHGVRGYGHTFPEAYTSWDTVVKGSSSHQRVMRYRFGGFNCIVRHEGDGFLPEKRDQSSQKLGAPEISPEIDVATLTDSLGASALHAPSPSHQSRLKVNVGGFHVSQSAVFDLKTRSSFRKGHDFLAEEIPRMWVSQIPNFILAYHTKGVFDDIEINDVSSELKAWEKTMSSELSILASLLQHIIRIARQRPDHKLEICRSTVDKLEIREQTVGIPSVLSEDVMKNWLKWLQGSGEDEDDECEIEEGRPKGVDDLRWDDESADFTACSTECGYCGRCTY